MLLLTSLIRYLRLESKARRLLAYGFVLQLGIRLGLWLAPYAKVQRVAERWVGANGAKSGASSELVEGRVIWAVLTSSRFIPRSTCFVRALAGQLMFRREGLQPVLRVGIAKDSNRQLKGHAWLEMDGRVLIGETEDLSQYTLLNFVRASKLKR